MSTENTTGSDLKQQLKHSSSTTIETENRYSQTQPHRKNTTLLKACKPMHISDARTKQRGTCGVKEDTSNTDINHEEECNSSASRSNSVERYRSPNNTSKNTGTQTTPSPSSSESREGKVIQDITLYMLFQLKLNVKMIEIHVFSILKLLRHCYRQAIV